MTECLKYQEESFVSKKQMEFSWSQYLSENETPGAIVMEPTNLCKGKCSHCYAKRAIGENTNQMEMEIFDNWLSVISSSSQKPKQIWFAGGEPTLYSRLKEMIEKAEASGFYTAVITRGDGYKNLSYTRSVVPNEIDVTLRGFGQVHDLLMLPSKNKLMTDISKKGLDPTEQMYYALNKEAEKLDKRKGVSKENNFNEAVKALLNITKVKTEMYPDVKIGLNLDAQTIVDLTQIVYFLLEKQIPVENIIIQIQTFSEKNLNLANTVPNLWRKPTYEMIKTYYEQANFLTENGILKGTIEIIDEIPEPILKELQLNEINLGQFYKPEKTPAISPLGKLRPNVIIEQNDYGN